MRQYVASKCQTTQKSSFCTENISVSFRNTSRPAQVQTSWSPVIISALLERHWHRLYKTQFQTQIISQRYTLLSSLTILRFGEKEIKWFKESIGKSQDTSCSLTPRNTVNRRQWLLASKTIQKSLMIMIWIDN